MRKSFDTLAAIVSEQLGADPVSGSLFVFSNRGRNRLKALWWDRGGFLLLSKRLESGTFAWPKENAVSVEYTHEEFALLVGGIDVAHVRVRRWFEPKQSNARSESFEKSWTNA